MCCCCIIIMSLSEPTTTSTLTGSIINISVKRRVQKWFLFTLKILVNLVLCCVLIITMYEIYRGHVLNKVLKGEDLFIFWWIKVNFFYCEIIIIMILKDVHCQYTCTIMVDGINVTLRDYIAYELQCTTKLYKNEACVSGIVKIMNFL